MTTPAPNRYSAPALEKGLDILEALAQTDGGYTLNELAQALGRNVNEIFRMVMTLQHRGYIAQGEPDDRYASPQDVSTRAPEAVSRWSARSAAAARACGTGGQSPPLLVPLRPVSLWRSGQPPNVVGGLSC